MSSTSFTYPSNYRYSSDHVWIKIDGDSATFGITEFAVHELGEMTLCDLPEVGQTFEAGDEIGSIESICTIHVLYAPLTCEILAVNEYVTGDPESIWEDPHDSGWLFKARIVSKAEIDTRVVG